MKTMLTNIKNTPITKISAIKNVGNGKIKAPLKAENFDFAKFDINGKNIEIITFRDSFNAILRRYIIKGKEITERNYLKLKNNTEIDDSIQGRKISSITKVNGKYFSKSEETQIVSWKNNSPILFIKKIVNSPLFKKRFERESQSIFQFRPNKNPKGYEISGYFKSPNSYMNDVFEPVFKFVNVSKEFKDFAQQDLYALLHLYSLKRFKKMAPSVSIHPEHKLEIPPKINWYNDKKQGDPFGYFDGEIYLNKNFANNRYNIIIASAHEKEHAYQLEQAIFSWIKNGNNKNPGFIKSKIFKIYKEYLKNPNSGNIDSAEDSKIYFDNFKNYSKTLRNSFERQNLAIERKAVDASDLAEEAYIKSMQRFKDEFKLAPDFLIGADNNDFKNFVNTLLKT